MRARANQFGRPESDTPLTFRSVAASILFHLIVLAALVLTPSRAPERKFLTSVINVSMVALPPRGEAVGGSGPTPFARESSPVVKKTGATRMVGSDEHLKDVIIPRKPESTVAVQDKPEVEPPAQKETPVEPVSPKPEARAEDKPAPEVSVAPKPPIKTSLKKKTFSSDKVVQPAIVTTEKQAEYTRPRQVEEAISRLRRSIGESQPPDSPSDGAGTGAGESGAPGGTLTGDARALELIDIYRAEIPYHINKNWAFNPQLADAGSDLMAVLVIKIMPDGEIRDIWFEKKSGNSHFDDSVFKAVKKANPLPALPKGYLRPFYNLGLIFTPSGLNRGSIR